MTCIKNFITAVYQQVACNFLLGSVLIIFSLTLLLYSTPSFGAFIDKLTVEEFFDFITRPENSDLLEFVRGFSIRLNEENGDRISFPDIHQKGGSDRYVTILERRMDALARLLVGDEVCAAVSYYCDETGHPVLLIATNSDGHWYERSKDKEPNHNEHDISPLYFRIYELLNYLVFCVLGNPQLTIACRSQFVCNVLPYSFIRSKTMLKLYGKAKLLMDETDRIEELEKEPVKHTDRCGFKQRLIQRKRIEINKLKEEIKQLKEKLEGTAQMQSLRVFFKKLCADFEKFEQEHAFLDPEEDLVEQWIDSLRGDRIKQMDPPDSCEIEKVFRVVQRFFQDVLKIENIGFHPFLIKVIDEGGEGVHAEMRIFAHAFLQGGNLCYIGINKLCCAYCNLALGIRNIDGESEYTTLGSAVPTRGVHAVAYPWPIHEKLRSSDEFLQRFLGSELYDSYMKMRGETIDLPKVKTKNRGSLALSILERLPCLRFDTDAKAKAKKLGILFPKADEKKQAPDSSTIISKVPRYLVKSKAIRVLEPPYLEFPLGTNGFFDAQEYKRNIYSGMGLIRKKVKETLCTVQPWDLSCSPYIVPVHSDRGDPYVLIDVPFKNSYIVDPIFLYDIDRVRKLLDKQLPKDVVKFTLAVEQNKEIAASLPRNRLREAFKAALNNELGAVIAIELRSNFWIGILLKLRKDGVMQIVYTNPLGYNSCMDITTGNFANRYFDEIAADLTPSNRPIVIELELMQVDNNIDSGPVIVDNLFRLSTYCDAEDLDREGIIEKAGLLKYPEYIDAIRKEHFELLDFHYPDPLENGDIASIQDLEDLEDFQLQQVNRITIEAITRARLLNDPANNIETVTPRWVEGDGDCAFTALNTTRGDFIREIDEIYRGERNELQMWLQNLFEGEVFMGQYGNYDNWLRMIRGGLWVGEFEINLIGLIRNVRIRIFRIGDNIFEQQMNAIGFLDAPNEVWIAHVNMLPVVEANANVRNHYIELRNQNTDGQGIQTIFQEHALLRNYYERYIETNRNNDPLIRRAYDMRFGLLLLPLLVKKI